MSKQKLWFIVEWLIHIAVILVVIFQYNYAVKFVSGLLENEWLKTTVFSNWNFRLLFILIGVGGGIGFLLSRLFNKIKNTRKVS